MTTLLAASVFGPGPRAAAAFRLQAEYLSRTASVPYTHAVWLLAGTDRAPFADAAVIGTGHATVAAAWPELAAYAAANPHDFTLRLTPDAFPCRAGWLPELAARRAVVQAGDPPGSYAVFAPAAPAGERVVLPRTNPVSLHPAMAEIYGDVVYLHGDPAGAADADDALFAALAANPERLLGVLRGR